MPGIGRVIASVGSEQNALMLTVEADFGAGPMTLPAARLYLLDEDPRARLGNQRRGVWICPQSGRSS